jgi:hypothetical protein
MLFGVLLYIFLALPWRGQWRSYDEATVSGSAQVVSS